MNKFFLSLIFLFSFHCTVIAEQIENNLPNNNVSKSSLLFSQITGSTVALCEAYLSGFIDEENSSNLIRAYLNQLDKRLGNDWLSIPKTEDSEKQYIYKPSKYVEGILLKKFPRCSILIKN